MDLRCADCFASQGPDVSRIVVSLWDELFDRMTTVGNGFWATITQ